MNFNQCKKIFSQNRKIHYVILFGSALGKLRRDSDVDFLIGGKLSFDEKAVTAGHLEKILGRRVDLVLTQEASCELALEAFSRGKILVSKNKERLKEDYFQKFYLYEDSETLRRLKTLRLKRKFKNGQ